MGSAVLGSELLQTIHRQLSQTSFECEEIGHDVHDSWSAIEHGLGLPSHGFMLRCRSSS